MDSNNPGWTRDQSVRTHPVRTLDIKTLKMESDRVHGGLGESTWIVQSAVDPKCSDRTSPNWREKLWMSVRLDRIILQNALIFLHQLSQMHTPMTPGVAPSLTPQSPRNPPVHLLSCQYSAISPTQLGQRWLLAVREKQQTTAWDLVTIVRLWGTRLARQSQQMGSLSSLTGPLW